MEELSRDKKAMAKPKFDESKLTAEQRKAVAIARAQNAPFSRQMSDLFTDLDQESADELADAIEQNRQRDRLASPKPSL